MLSKKLKGAPSQFQASSFTATQWNTAEDKSRLANKLTKFILNGFQQASFTEEMYKRLSSMFGHIAEYNIHGFYSVWFEDDQACLKWAENAVRGGLLGLIVGNPRFTWSDVEKAIKRWMIENQIVGQIQNICNGNADQNTVDIGMASPVQIGDRQLALFEGNATGARYG